MDERRVDGVAKASGLEEDGSLSLLELSQGGSIDGESLDLNFVLNASSGEMQQDKQGYENHFPSRPSTDKHDKLDQSVRFDTKTDEILDGYKKRAAEGKLSSGHKVDIPFYDMDDDVEDEEDNSRGEFNIDGRERGGGRERGVIENHHILNKGELGFGESKVSPMSGGPDRMRFKVSIDGDKKDIFGNSLEEDSTVQHYGADNSNSNGNVNNRRNGNGRPVSTFEYVRKDGEDNLDTRNFTDMARTQMFGGLSVEKTLLSVYNAKTTVASKPKHGDDDDMGQSTLAGEALSTCYIYEIDYVGFVD